MKQGGSAGEKRTWNVERRKRTENLVLAEVVVVVREQEEQKVKKSK